MTQLADVPVDQDPKIWSNWQEGAFLGRATVQVTPELLKKYVGGIHKKNPAYEKPGPDGKQIVATCAITREVQKLTLNPPATAVPHTARNAGQEYEFIRPIYIGDTLTLTANAAYMRPAGGGNRVIYASAVTAVNQDGEEVAKITFHRTYMTRGEPRRTLLEKQQS